MKKTILFGATLLVSLSYAADPIDNGEVQNTPASGGAASILVTDADPSTAARTEIRHLQGTADGQVLSWDNTAGTWSIVAGFAGSSITDGTNTETIGDGDTITFAGGTLLEATVSPTDTVTFAIDTTGAAAGDVLTYNGTDVAWVDGQTHPAATVGAASNPALSIVTATQVLSLDLTAANSYNNTASGLTADSVQGAIDELAANGHVPAVIAPGSNPAITIAGPTQAIDLDLDAAGSYDNTTSGATEDSVQDAIDYLYSIAVRQAKRTVAVPATTESVAIAVPALPFVPSSVYISVESDGSEELGVNDWHGTLTATGGITVELQGQASAAGTHTLHLLFCE